MIITAMATWRQMATNSKMSSGLYMQSGDTTYTPFKGCSYVASKGFINHVSSPLREFRTLIRSLASREPTLGSIWKNLASGNSDGDLSIHIEFPERSKIGTVGSYSVITASGNSDGQLFPVTALNCLLSISDEAWP